MKKLLFIFASCCVLNNAHAKLNVVTTTTDLAAIAKAVGGDLVDVKSLANPNLDPHYIEPKPSSASAMNKADLFIQVGMSLEAGWVPPLLRQSRNPKIQKDRSGYLNASEGIHKIGVPTGKIDRSQGDIHPEGNPHYWLDPRNGLIIAEAIMKSLQRIDPAHEMLYQSGKERFDHALRSKIARWEKQAQPLKGQKFIAHHMTYEYLAQWLRFTIVRYIEPKPGIPPHAKHVAEMIETVRKNKVPLILSEKYFNPKPAKKIAAETGAKMLILPASTEGSYESLFDTLITKIIGAL